MIAVAWGCSPRSGCSRDVFPGSRVASPVALPAVPEFQTSPGMRDILPPESARWRRFVEVFAAGGRGGRLRPGHLAAARGPRRVPAHRRRHRRGHQGDVRLRRQGRPPHRAAARAHRHRSCRAFVQHRPLTPWKVWYAGSHVPLREAPAWPLPPVRPGRHRGARRRRPLPRRRGHRPRLGVLRGARAAAGDAAAQLARRARRPGPLRRRRCRRTSRPTSTTLSAESRVTLQKNPLRVLDSQARRRTPPLVAAAPQIADFYSADAAAHFEAVQAGLRALGIPFTVDPKLVRGLDYYRHTTFEYQGGTLDSAQNALGGGGRYDGLVESLGGPATPGVGFALGLDRTLLACDDEGVFAAPSAAVDVFVVDTTGGLRGAADHRRAARRRRSRRPRLREPQHEEPDEGRRPQRRRLRRHRRQQRARRRHRGGAPAARRTAADGTGRQSPSPAPISSTTSRKPLP